jgi:hypothetical protein
MSNGVFSGMHLTVSNVAVAPPAKTVHRLADVWVFEPRTSTAFDMR